MKSIVGKVSAIDIDTNIISKIECKFTIDQTKSLLHRLDMNYTMKNGMYNPEGMTNWIGHRIDREPYPSDCEFGEAYELIDWNTITKEEIEKNMTIKHDMYNRKVFNEIRGEYLATDISFTLYDSRFKSRYDLRFESDLLLEKSFSLDSDSDSDNDNDNEILNFILSYKDIIEKALEPLKETDSHVVDFLNKLELYKK